MTRPATLTISISKPDLLAAICSKAESEGERGDYNWWVRQFLRKKLKVKEGAVHKSGCRKIKLNKQEENNG